jgi:hypothetical protein
MVNFRRNTPAEDEGDSTLKGNNFLFVVDMVVTVFISHICDTS